MLHVFKHSPQYKSQQDHIEMIGKAPTKAGAIEVLRKHFLNWNQMLVDKAEDLQIPDCIVNLAKQSVEHNPKMVISTNEQGVVFIDGQGPEMDYYTIKRGV